MEKIKNWFSDNLGYLSLLISAVAGILFTYIGYAKGFQKSDKSKKEAEISALNIGAENAIIKEKLADKAKGIDEISKDVDDILDRK
jgi:hypothetical protein